MPMPHSALLLLAAASLLAPAACQQRPPFWGPHWTAPFNQSITIYAWQWNNSVTWQYDAGTLPVGSSMYLHSKGQHDEICTGVKGHETTEEPCNLLASSDTWRYVIFPESSQCCRVCNTTEFCGIVASDWLQKNSSYQGEKQIAGLDCEGWMKEGGEQNYYYAETSTQQPCEYYVSHSAGQGQPGALQTSRSPSSSVQPPSPSC